MVSREMFLGSFTLASFATRILSSTSEQGRRNLRPKEQPQSRRRAVSRFLDDLVGRLLGALQLEIHAGPDLLKLDARKLKAKRTEEMR